MLDMGAYIVIVLCLNRDGRSQDSPLRSAASCRKKSAICHIPFRYVQVPFRRPILPTTTIESGVQLPIHGSGAWARENTGKIPHTCSFRTSQGRRRAYHFQQAYLWSEYDVELDIRTPEDPCQGRAAQLSRMLVSIGCPTLVRAANYKQARAPSHPKGVLARPARRISHGSVFIINLSNARVTSTAES